VAGQAGDLLESCLQAQRGSEGLRDLAAGPRRDFGSYGRINIGDPCGLVLLGFRLLAWKLAPVCRFRKKWKESVCDASVHEIVHLGVYGLDRAASASRLWRRCLTDLPWSRWPPAATWRNW